MKDKILALIREEADAPNATAETPLEALNLDSLEFLDLIVAISSEIGFEIPDTRIDGLQTVGDLVALAEEIAA